MFTVQECKRALVDTKDGDIVLYFSDGTSTKEVQVTLTDKLAWDLYTRLQMVVRSPETKSAYTYLKLDDDPDFPSILGANYYRIRKSEPNEFIQADYLHDKDGWLPTGTLNIARRKKIGEIEFYKSRGAYEISAKQLPSVGQ